MAAGFVWLRSRGSHRIYGKSARRVVNPFHGSTQIHPRIIKQAQEAIEEA